jgi:intracellular sulfur oxidation DsrE/DsrF family protein
VEHNHILTMRKIFCMRNMLFVIMLGLASVLLCLAQSSVTGAADKATADSLARAKTVADSLKMEKLFAIAQYPYIKGSKWSGVIPVADPTEIPDPKREYKLLFEVTAKNPDSLAREINNGLDEVARVMNLHFASGIPAHNIIPVIVVHGPALQAIANNAYYKKKHAIDNPNIKLVHDLVNAGAKIIACGQAMAFFEVTKEDLLPEIKVSLTAQTVLSNYQLQGYVLYKIEPDK